MIEELQSTPPFEWYETYIKTRVMPKLSADMGDCQGFFEWLGEKDPELYNKITAALDELSTLILSRADRKSFEEACRVWYFLLMEAKKGFEAWKAKEREQVLLAGKQETMVM